MQTTIPKVLTLLGSLTLNGGLHTGRLNTCGVPTLRQILKTAQDRELGERRGERQKSSLKCIPVLAYSEPWRKRLVEMGWGWGYSMRPPADRARDWMIHQQANQADLEHTETCASDAAEKHLSYSFCHSRLAWFKLLWQWSYQDPQY